MSAALRFDATDPDAVASRTMQALALMDEGLSCRDAARKIGIHWSTVYAAAKRREEIEAAWEAGELVSKRLVAKARVAAELGVERILRDIATVHERYVAPWTLTAAKLAGMTDGAGMGQDGVSPTVAQLLSALGERKGPQPQSTVLVSRSTLETTVTGVVIPDSGSAGGNSPVIDVGGDIPE